MLVWLEAHPKRRQHQDISLYNNRLEFCLTPPGNQNIVPVSVLSVIRNAELYSYNLKYLNLIKKGK